MKTAIVIPVKNEQKGVALLIECLVGQLAPGDEIIFVDAGSTDRTREIIRFHATRHACIKLIVSEGAFPGKGRNVAIQHTNAEIIAQIDGGSLPKKDWLPRICAPIKGGKVDYVTGGIRPMPIPAIFGGVEIDKGVIFGLVLFGLYLREKTKTMAGGNSAAYRRWIWEEVNGFPEWCRSGEDPLFIKKVEKLKIRGTFVRDAIV